MRFMAKNSASYKLLYLDGSNKPSFYLNGLTTNPVVTAQNALVVSVWTHVAGVYDSSATKLRIYINGELSNELTASGSATDTNSVFAIGRDGPNASGYFDGLIRNARVWSVARTQAQIRADMNVDTPSVTTGLVSNWILNNDYVDAVSAYNLTASGSPTFATVYPDSLALTENGVYTQKHKIEIQHSQVAGSADIENIPIVLTEGCFLADAFSNSLNGGADLRFSTDIDGKIRLAHEVVSWDTSADTGEIWVKANTLDYDNDTDIWVHYGNATATAIDENEAFGKHQVYASTVELIQHLQSSSLDSTKASSDGTDTSMTYTTGKIKSAGTFNGSSSKIDMPSLGGSINSYSIAFWVNLSATTGSILVGTFSTGGASPGVYFSYNHLTANQLTFVNYNGSNAVINGGALSTGTWYHIVGTRDSSGNGKLYINAGSPVTGTLQTVNLGESANSTGYFRPSPQLYLNGQLDEIQIFSRVLTADEITTLYNNQNSPSTFAIPQSLSNASNFFLFL